MSDSVAPATVRLTVVGDSGRVDLAVPLWSDLTTVAAGYVERTGSAPVRLCTTTGTPLSTDAPVHSLRLTHGDLLVAVVEQGYTRTSLPADATDEHDDLDESVPPPSVVARLAPPAAMVLALVAAVSGLVTGGRAAEAAIAGLLVLALAIAAAAQLARSVHAAWLCVAPALAGAAAFISTQPATTGGELPGALLLGGAAAGLAVAAASAAIRSAWPGVADEALLVQITGGVVVAVIGAVCLVARWSDPTFWTLVLVAAVVAIRILPGLVVDVPDHVLLDFARLAATAWSAREQPRKSFRGTVREDDVKLVAARSQRLVSTASILCSGAAVSAGGALLLSDLSQSRYIGVLLVCGAAGASLTLSGRSMRARVARRWQRTAGTVLMGGVATSVLLDLGPDARPAAAAAAILVGLLLAVVARATGRGWSSVWWSRSAEIAEGLAGVVVLGALPLASGLFAWMRLLTSP